MIIFYLLILSLPLVDHPQIGYEIFGSHGRKVAGSRLLLPGIVLSPNSKIISANSGYRASAGIRRLRVVAIASYMLMVTPFDWHEMVGIIFVELIFFITTSIFIDSRQRLENSLLVLVGSIGLASLYLIREWAGVRLDLRTGISSRQRGRGSEHLLGLGGDGSAHHGCFCSRREWMEDGFLRRCLLVTIVAILLASSRGAFHRLGRAPASANARCASPRKIIVIAIIIVALFLVSPVSPLERLLHPSESDWSPPTPACNSGALPSASSPIIPFWAWDSGNSRHTCANTCRPE